MIYSFRNIFLTFLLSQLLLLPSFMQAQRPQGAAAATGPNAPREAAGIVTGAVVDQNTGHAVEYANVVLFKAKDSTMINGGITNGKGHFRLENIPFGKYYAIITFLGYSNKKIPDVLVTPKNLHFDLGRVELTGASARLAEVTITGEKPAMEFSLDRKVINVEKNIATLGGSAVDVLQNVPSVTVDENGGVSLRGDANVTLLIDGRPSGLTGTKLDQIPATSIESVELITNPSARYNPEGMSGIINIKLKKKRESGFNGLVSLNAGTGEKFNGSVNLNYNVGHFNFFGSVDARNDKRKGWGDMNRKTFYTDSVSIVDQTSDNWRKRNSAGYKFGVDYAIDSKNTLLLSWMSNSGPMKGHEFSESTISSGSGLITKLYTLESNEEDDDFSNDYVLNYRRSFNRPGQELTLDVVFNTDEEKELEDVIQNISTNILDTVFPLVSPAPLRNNTNTHRENGNIQLNYVHPLNEKVRLEGGYQGIFRYTDDDYGVFSFNQPGNDWLEDTLQSNRFVYKEQINALYAIFGMTQEKYSIQAGLRVENAHTISDQKTMDSIYDKNYNSLYPSFHATHKLPRNQEVQVSYSRRVNRPNMHSLNPFIDRSDPLTLHYGNPYLNPEYISIYEIGYSKYFKKSTFNGNIFYRDIKDVIKRRVFVDTTNNQEVYNISTLNLSSGISYGIELVLDHQFYKWWRINANFSYFKTKINGDNVDNSLTNENYSWTSRVNNTFVLPYKLTLQLNGFYRGPMVNPQGTMKEMYAMDFAVRKEFWKDRASVSLRISDIFNTSAFRVENEGSNYYAEMERRRESRVAYLGFTYKIGKNGKSQKKARKPDENGGREMEEFDF
ncbi:MAG: TonB-dependent receptor [Bacteroidales bacterium]